MKELYLVNKETEYAISGMRAEGRGLVLLYVTVIYLFTNVGDICLLLMKQSFNNLL